MRQADYINPPIPPHAVNRFPFNMPTKTLRERMPEILAFLGPLYPKPPRKKR